MLLLADLQLQGLTAERQCDFAARYSRSLWTEWARPRAGACAWRGLSWSSCRPPADARWELAEGEREPSPLLGRSWINRASGPPWRRGHPRLRALSSINSTSARVISPSAPPTP